MSEDAEEWRWIEGYEGLYQVSNKGNLKSFHRNKQGGQVRSLTNCRGWYLSVLLINSEGIKTTKKIHQLVAEAFIGKVAKGYHVHHKDGNKQNNNVNNLEIVHPSKHFRLSIQQNSHLLDGMNNYNKYVRPEPIRQYTLDGHYIAEYANSKIAEQFTGVCQRNILQVASHTPYGKDNHVRTQAGGYKWIFRKDDVN